MVTVHTKPRQTIVSYVRPGDEIAVWQGGDFCAMWRDHYESNTEWLVVQDKPVPADPEVPLGTQVITFWGGEQRKVNPDYFIVIRESVQVPDELLCTCG